VYYPKYLGFIRKISGLLSINLYEPKDAVVEIPFNNFLLLNRNISLFLYYYYQSYDLLANNNIYGIKGKFQIIPSIANLSLILETGYQQYVDVKYDLNQFYNNTFFFKFGFEWIGDKFYARGISMFDNKYNQYPGFDLSIGIRFDSFKPIVTSGRFYIQGDGENVPRKWGVGGKILTGLY
jgi:hypothetical protein